MPSWCIVYLASPKDRRIFGTGARKLDILRASLRIARACFPETPIFVFHEDFGEEEKALCPEVTEFHPVDFETGSEEYVKYEFPKGYMMMCRFFSGILQKHPRLQDFTHYMRLDDDSYFLEPIPTPALIAGFLTKDYVYRSVFHDRKEHQGLYDFTIEFLRSKGATDASIRTLEVHLRTIGFLDGSRQYTGLAPYNNFHLSSLRLWSNPLIAEYTDRLERVHAILRKGWLDANIHSMIVFVLLPFIGYSSHLALDFGYRHNKHVSSNTDSSIRWVDSLPFHPRFSDLPPCE